MPAAWQASGTLLGSTGADITPVIPAHQADDLLLCLAASRSTTETCLTPSGWNALLSPRDTTAWRAYLFWKWAASGAETNPLLDWSAATGEKYGQVHTIRGAGRIFADPFDDSVFFADATDPISGTGCTSIPAFGDDLLIIVGIGSDNASTSVAVSDTASRTYTERHFSTIATGADATGWFHDAPASGGFGGNQDTVTCDFNSTMPAAAVFCAYIRPPRLPFQHFAQVRT